MFVPNSFSPDEWQCLGRCEAADVLLSLERMLETNRDDSQGMGCMAADTVSDRDHSKVTCAASGQYTRA